MDTRSPSRDLGPRRRLATTRPAISWPRMVPGRARVGTLEDARVGAADAHRERRDTHLAGAGLGHRPRAEAQVADALEPDARLMPDGRGRAVPAAVTPAARAAIIPYIISSVTVAANDPGAARRRMWCASARRRSTAAHGGSTLPGADGRVPADSGMLAGGGPAATAAVALARLGVRVGADRASSATTSPGRLIRGASSQPEGVGTRWLLAGADDARSALSAGSSAMGPPPTRSLVALRGAAAARDRRARAGRRRGMPPADGST